MLDFCATKISKRLARKLIWRFFLHVTAIERLNLADFDSLHRIRSLQCVCVCVTPPTLYSITWLPIKHHDCTCLARPFLTGPVVAHCYPFTQNVIRSFKNCNTRFHLSPWPCVSVCRPTGFPLLFFWKTKPIGRAANPSGLICFLILIDFLIECPFFLKTQSFFVAGFGQNFCFCQIVWQQILQKTFGEWRERKHCQRTSTHTQQRQFCVFTKITKWVVTAIFWHNHTHNHTHYHTHTASDVCRGHRLVQCAHIRQDRSISLLFCLELLFQWTLKVLTTKMMKASNLRIALQRCRQLQQKTLPLCSTQRYPHLLFISLSSHDSMK